jgi:CHASE3 domain sensor protein
MKMFKKVMRHFGLVLLILLALSGVSLTGTFLPVYKDKFLDNEVRTEQVDKKKDEEESAAEEKN